ncbi:hypothetical protein K227x_02550 [Rubripirellula lacrimiformis]|uniref:Uncharacterized protein n=1 Tax=Rubripirellula lacrimiformis TaxID=1930273 RepID=A0A517N428_9BACT|nr:hypothetical protein K227x_02550 [Rubripirellula lacrimiformis]
MRGCCDGRGKFEFKFEFEFKFLNIDVGTVAIAKRLIKWKNPGCLLVPAPNLNSNLNSNSNFSSTPKTRGMVGAWLLKRGGSSSSSLSF